MSSVATCCRLFTSPPSTATPVPEADEPSERSKRLIDLAAVLGEAVKHAEAEAAAREAVEVARKARGSVDHPDVVEALAAVALSAYRAGRPAASDAAARDVLAMGRRLPPEAWAGRLPAAVRELAEYLAGGGLCGIRGGRS